VSVGCSVELYGTNTTTVRVKPKTAIKTMKLAMSSVQVQKGSSSSLNPCMVSTRVVAPSTLLGTKISEMST
jgi:hypothetical protein